MRLLKFKKGKIIFFAAATLILLVAAFFLFNKKFEIQTRKEVDFSLNNDANIKIGNFDVMCSILRSQEGITNIEIKSPETLKGLKFSYLGDHQEFELGKIVVKNQEDALPVTSFPSYIFKILNHASKQEQKYKKISSTTDGLNYVLEADDDGKIKSIKSLSINLEINF